MGSEVRLGTVIRATLRAVYGDLVTVVVTSALFVLVALPVVTVGAGVLALIETWTDVLTRRDTGAPPSERGRAGLFLASVRRNLVAGLPYSAVLAAVVGLTAVYYTLSVSQELAVFLLATLVGLYAVVIAIVWCLRAASFRVRSDPPLGARGSFHLAGQTFVDHPSFTVLVAAAVAGVLLAGSAAVVTVVLLVPGVLAIIEVVAFEEVAGDGAAAIRSTYRRSG